ncbi:MAG: GAF domain-containing protein [Candidatus Zixiibacteriota bacterium]|nr:MAG: GAF domain-containing protein [candidate division Zixibacteria bacterium]
MERQELFDTLLERIKAITAIASNKEFKLEVVCNLLSKNIAGYDWVGFYRVDKSRKRELVLGPFVGEPTEHVRIPFGKGICGRAADSEETFLVQDVTKEDNYLACSPKVRSEIVVPIFRNGELVGELDIDSHTPSAFSKKDSEFLSKVGELVSHLI